MWKLTSPSKDLINWYEKKMCTSLVSRIKASLDKRISKVLIPTLPTGGDDLSIVKRFQVLLIFSLIQLFPVLYYSMDIICDIP